MCSLVIIVANVFTFRIAGRVARKLAIVASLKEGVWRIRVQDWGGRRQADQESRENESCLHYA